MSPASPRISAALGAGLLAAACSAPGHAPVQPSAAREEIYVLRSIRERHVPVASFCDPAKTGFEPFSTDAERAFSFWSVSTTEQDGRVIETQKSRVAALRGCFGATAERARQRFYAEIDLGSTSARGTGECSAVMLDFPEPHLFPVHCFLVLDRVPAGYVGGLLTTNTLTSKSAYGGDTDPPGYSQASIATIRLWRSPKRREFDR
jgi:hypothetical protein